MQSCESVETREIVFDLVQIICSPLNDSHIRLSQTLIHFRLQKGQLFCPPSVYSGQYEQEELVQQPNQTLFVYTRVLFKIDSEHCEPL